MVDDIVLTPNGIFKIHPGDRIINSWLTNNLVYETQFINGKLKNIVKKARYIIDAGANIGCHAISYARFNPGAKIYAFEPQKELFDILETNKTLNQSINLVCINSALGHTEMDVFIGEPPKSDDGVNFGGAGIGSGGEKTRMITIDSMNLPGLDFIKMDIQGSEGIAIVGGKETILKYKPVIFFEHDYTFIKPSDVGLETIPSPFFELTKLGYNTFTHLGENNYITHWDPEPNFSSTCT